MTSDSDSSNRLFADDPKIEEKDLQLVLRSTLGERVIVKKSTTSSLLPPGENFACLIYKVDATINRNANKQNEDEELHLIAKLFPTAEAVRGLFDFTCLFRKEIFFYEKLVPMMKEIEIEFGAKETETFDITPKLYGARRSLDPANKNVDDGVMILMENLKQKGYYTLDKVEGLDLTHSKLAITSLARMHGLAIACKHHRPEFFKNEVLEYAKFVPFQQDNVKGDVYEILYEMMCKDSRMNEIRDRIYKLMDTEVKMKFFTFVAEEPWLSVAHLDFWTTNILYHKDERGDLDDIKFIDFQNYTYNSPLRDLPYFLCTSTSHEVMTKHFKELLDLYYDTLIEILKKAHCDVEAFSRSSFDEQLKLDATLEFFHNILAIKFFYAEIDKNSYDPSQIHSVVIFSDINSKGYDKWYQLILTYIEQGWL